MKTILTQPSPPVPEVLSQGELERIRELCDKATPGPWWAPHDDLDYDEDDLILIPMVMANFAPHILHQGSEDEEECEGCEDCLNPVGQSHDSAFIEAARVGIPDLLDAITYLLERNAEAVEEVDRLQRALEEFCEEAGHCIEVKYKGASEWSCQCGRVQGKPPHHYWGTAEGGKP